MAGNKFDRCFQSVNDTTQQKYAILKPYIHRLQAVIQRIQDKNAPDCISLKLDKFQGLLNLINPNTSYALLERVESILERMRKTKWVDKVFMQADELEEIRNNAKVSSSKPVEDIKKMVIQNLKTINEFENPTSGDLLSSDLTQEHEVGGRSHMPSSLHKVTDKMRSCIINTPEPPVIGAIHRLERHYRNKSPVRSENVYREHDCDVHDDINKRRSPDSVSSSWEKRPEEQIKSCDSLKNERGTSWDIINQMQASSNKWEKKRDNVNVKIGRQSKHDSKEERSKRGKSSRTHSKSLFYDKYMLRKTETRKSYRSKSKNHRNSSKSPKFKDRDNFESEDSDKGASVWNRLGNKALEFTEDDSNSTDENFSIDKLTDLQIDDLIKGEPEKFPNLLSVSAEDRRKYLRKLINDRSNNDEFTLHTEIDDLFEKDDVHPLCVTIQNDMPSEIHHEDVLSESSNDNTPKLNYNLICETTQSKDLQETEFDKPKSYRPDNKASAKSTSEIGEAESENLTKMTADKTTISSSNILKPEESPKWEKTPKKTDKIEGIDKSVDKFSTSTVKGDLRKKQCKEVLKKSKVKVINSSSISTNESVPNHDNKSPREDRGQSNQEEKFVEGKREHSPEGKSLINQKSSYQSTTPVKRDSSTDKSSSIEKTPKEGKLTSDLKAKCETKKSRDKSLSESPPVPASCFSKTNAKFKESPTSGEGSKLLPIRHSFDDALSTAETVCLIKKTKKPKSKSCSYNSETKVCRPENSPSLLDNLRKADTSKINYETNSETSEKNPCRSESGSCQLIDKKLQSVEKDDETIYSADNSQADRRSRRNILDLPFPKFAEETISKPVDPRKMNFTVSNEANKDVFINNSLNQPRMTTGTANQLPSLMSLNTKNMRPQLGHHSYNVPARPLETAYVDSHLYQRRVPLSQDASPCCLPTCSENIPNNPVVTNVCVPMVSPPFNNTSPSNVPRTYAEYKMLKQKEESRKKAFEVQDRHKKLHEDRLKQHDEEKRRVLELPVSQIKNDPRLKKQGGSSTQSTNSLYGAVIHNALPTFKIPKLSKSACTENSLEANKEAEWCSHHTESEISDKDDKSKNSAEFLSHAPIIDKSNAEISNVKNRPSVNIPFKDIYDDSYRRRSKRIKNRRKILAPSREMVRQQSKVSEKTIPRINNEPNQPKSDLITSEPFADGNNDQQDEVNGQKNLKHYLQKKDNMDETPSSISDVGKNDIGDDSMKESYAETDNANITESSQQNQSLVTSEKKSTNYGIPENERKSCSNLPNAIGNFNTHSTNISDDSGNEPDQLTLNSTNNAKSVETSNGDIIPKKTNAASIVNDKPEQTNDLGLTAVGQTDLKLSSENTDANEIPELMSDRSNSIQSTIDMSQQTQDKLRPNADSSCSKSAEVTQVLDSLVKKTLQTEDGKRVLAQILANNFNVDISNLLPKPIENHSENSDSMKNSEDLVSQSESNDVLLNYNTDQAQQSNDVSSSNSLDFLNSRSRKRSKRALIPRRMTRSVTGKNTPDEPNLLQSDEEDDSSVNTSIQSNSPEPKAKGTTKERAKRSEVDRLYDDFSSVFSVKDFSKSSRTARSNDSLVKLPKTNATKSKTDLPKLENKYYLPQVSIVPISSDAVSNIIGRRNVARRGGISPVTTNRGDILKAPILIKSSLYLLRNLHKVMRLKGRKLARKHCSIADIPVFVPATVSEHPTLDNMTMDIRLASHSIKETYTTPNSDKLSYCLSKDVQFYACLLCCTYNLKPNQVTAHYKTKHPQHEVEISRFSIEEAQNALRDAREHNDYELENSFSLNTANSKMSYACRFCGSIIRTTTAEALFIHFSEHTGEYRWQCPAENCNMTFLTIENVRHHISWKHDVKDRSRLIRTVKELFPLPTTNKGFNIFGYLCSACNYVQMLKSNVVQHVVKAHPVMTCPVQIIKVTMVHVIKTAADQKKAVKNLLHIKGPPLECHLSAINGQNAISGSKDIGDNTTMFDLEIKEGPKYCLICNNCMLNANLETLFQHICTHMYTDYTWCCPSDGCNLKFPSIDLLKDHIASRVHGIRERNRLNGCIQEYFLQSALSNGFLCGFMCSLCNYVQHTRANVEKHITQRHVAVKNPVQIIKIDLFSQMEYDSDKKNNSKSEAHGTMDEDSAMSSLKRSSKKPIKPVKHTKKSSAKLSKLNKIRKWFAHKQNIDLKKMRRRQERRIQLKKLIEKEKRVEQPTSDNVEPTISPSALSEPVFVKQEHRLDIETCTWQMEHGLSHISQSETAPILKLQRSPAKTKMEVVTSGQTEEEDTTLIESRPPLSIKRDLEERAVNEIEVPSQPLVRVCKMETLMGIKRASSPSNFEESIVKLELNENVNDEVLQPVKPVPEEIDLVDDDDDDDYNGGGEGIVTVTKNDEEQIVEDDDDANFAPVIVDVRGRTEDVKEFEDETEAVTDAMIERNDVSPIKTQLPQKEQIIVQTTRMPLNINLSSVVQKQAKRSQAFDISNAILQSKIDFAYKKMLLPAKLKELFKCPIPECFYTSNISADFVRHMILHETEKITGKRRRCDFKCCYCFTTLQSPTSLTNHILNEHGQNAFQCRYCFYRAYTSFYVELHQNLHHSIAEGSEEHILRCAVHRPSVEGCSYGRQRRSKSVRPYFCYPCKFSCYQTSSFAEHNRIRHPNAKNLSCNHCHQGGFKAGSLLKHYQRHCYNNYQCAYCLHGAERDSDMLYHLSNIHFSKPAYMYLRDDGVQGKQISGTDPKGAKVIFFRQDDVPNDITHEDSAIILTEEVTASLLKQAEAAETEAAIHAITDENIEYLEENDESSVTISINETDVAVNSNTIDLESLVRSIGITDIDQQPLTLVIPSDSEKVRKLPLNDEFAVLNVPTRSEPELVDTLPPRVQTTPLSYKSPSRGNQSHKLLDDNIDGNCMKEQPLVVDPLSNSIAAPSTVITEKKTGKIMHLKTTTDVERKFSAAIVVHSSTTQKPVIIGTKDDNERVVARHNLPGIVLSQKSTIVKKVSSTSLTSDYKDCEVIEIANDTATVTTTATSTIIATVTTTAANTTTTATTTTTTTATATATTTTAVSNTRDIRRDMARLRNTNTDALLVDESAGDVSSLKVFEQDEPNPVTTSPKSSLKVQTHVAKTQSNQEKEGTTIQPANNSTFTCDKESNIATYGPDDINKLPLSMIFPNEVMCSVCGFKNKVRYNMRRHLEMHLRGVAVPKTAPTNPVPCLERNELMFNQMTNHAASSLADRATVERLTEREIASLPGFVREQFRFKCGAPDCCYITTDGHMLKQHTTTLHPDAGNKYRCPHCPDTVPTHIKEVPLDEIALHLKHHDSKLYRCAHCEYCHFMKQAVEKHIFDEHPDRRNYVHVVREPEGMPDKTKKRAEKSSAFYCCNICPDFRNPDRSEMLRHLQRTHKTRDKFMCDRCKSTGRTPLIVKAHIDRSHVGCKANVTSTSRQEGDINNSIQLPMKPLWNPTWQNHKAPRLIRGIPVDDVESTATLEDVRVVGGGKTIRIAKGAKKAATKLKFSCTLCSFTTNEEENLRTHIYEELSYEQFTCSLCQHKVYSLEQGEDHLKKHYGEINVSLIKGQTNSQIESMIEKSISNQKKMFKKPCKKSPKKKEEPCAERGQVKPFIQKCKNCSFTSLPSIIGLHSTRVHHTRFLSCKYCSSMLPTCDELSQHEVTDHSWSSVVCTEKDSYWIDNLTHYCVECHHFENKYINMTKHLELHAWSVVKWKYSDIQLDCMYCSVTNRTKQEVIQHWKEMHESEGASLAVKVSGHVCHGLGAYQCPKCFNTFWELDECEKHLEEEHFSKRRCGSCPLTFDTNADLESHCQSMTHEKITEEIDSAAFVLEKANIMVRQHGEWAVPRPKRAASEAVLSPSPKRRYTARKSTTRRARSPRKQTLLQVKDTAEYSEFSS